MKINIGAGATRYPGYINCDYDTRYNPEYVFDMEKDKWPFDDNSVTNIIAYHVLEHMGEGYFHVLKEMYRVSKPGTTINIKVPHYNHRYFHHDPTHRRAITAFGLTLFSKKFNDTDTTAASKLGYFFNVDFEVICEDYTFDPEILRRYGHWSREELLNYALEHNNIIEEIQITLAVIKGTREDQIQGYYYSLLDRAPDEAGLSHYLNSTYSEADVRKILIESEEYKQLLKN